MVLSNKEWLDKMDEIISAIQNGGGDIQVIEYMLSNMWISSVTYNVGDYVLYNNNIWKCLVQNSNIAPSDGTTWTRVNITSEISTLRFKQLGIIYASGELAINTNDYSEILFEFLPNADDNFEGTSILFIPSSYNFSTKNYIVLKTGNYIDTNNCASYSISLTATKAQVGNYAHYKNGTNVTQKVKVIIYGKK